MRQKSVPAKEPATQVVKNIRRATRRHFSAEDKIRIVLEGLRCEDSIAELCRREGIVQNFYYRWSKEFLEWQEAIPLRTVFDAPRLRAAARGTKDSGQTRRLLALAAIYDGARRTEAATIARRFFRNGWVFCVLKQCGSKNINRYSVFGAALAAGVERSGAAPSCGRARPHSVLRS